MISSAVTDSACPTLVVGRRHTYKPLAQRVPAALTPGGRSLPPRRVSCARARSHKELQNTVIGSSLCPTASPSGMSYREQRNFIEILRHVGYPLRISFSSFT